MYLQKLPDLFVIVNLLIYSKPVQGFHTERLFGDVLMKKFLLIFYLIILNLYVYDEMYVNIKIVLN